MGLFERALYERPAPVRGTAKRFRMRAGLAAGILTLIATVGRAGAEDIPRSSLRVSAESDIDFAFSASADYSQGKYGTGHTTQILYVPASATWYVTDRFELTLTIPYLWEHGRNIFATIGTAPAETAQRVASRGATTLHARTEDGLGDILLGGSYVLFQEKAVLPEVSPFVTIKFPTAESSNGLGTGEFDETLGVEFIKGFGDRWTAYLELSYTFVGSPSHLRLDNSFGWLAGVALDVSPSLRVGLALEGATAVSRGEQNPLDLRLAAEYKIGKVVTLFGSVAAGLSRNSADFGVSAGVKLGF